MHPFLRLLSERLVFADGGMGTLLQKRGLGAGEAPERWNLSRPGDVAAVHREYFAAGSDFVLSNTFGANPVKLAADGGAGLCRDVVAAGVAAARRARDEAGRGFVALDLGPTGKLLSPLGDLDFERAVAAFAEAVRAGARAGADLVFVETMSDLHELKAAVLAAKENCDLPVVASATFDSRRQLLTGASPEIVAAVAEGLRADAVGVNCGVGPDAALAVVEALCAASSVPVSAKPNAGLPRIECGVTTYPTGPEAFAEQMEALARAGARLLGGCCGTTPAHIAALRARCAGIPPVPVEPKARTVATSGSRLVEISSANPVVIGERINPTGKKRFREALEKGDMPYVLARAVEQQEAGADALDVNVGVPGLDEKTLLPDVVSRLQAVTDLPLQLDSSDPAALEAALRRYDGKALVNSASGKRESLEAVLPLVAKYGGVLVCLCLDESGIPPAAEGRLAIARRIAEAAEARGIPRKDLLFDVLCMSVGSDAAAAVETLRALRLVASELGVNTSLGVSNVSFGLPRRDVLNASFFTLALGAGLSAGIVNPNDPAMRSAWLSWRALAGLDPGFARYIEAHPPLPRSAPASPAPSGALRPSPPPGGAAAPSAGGDAPGAALSAAVRRGLGAEAARLAREALAAGTPPMELVDGALVPALDETGRGFEAGTVFLPQLLAAAEAAGAAFGEVKRAIAESGAPRERAGRIALATVKGDVHDIGKNIVKVLLENYGYEVIDLGKDVPPETVVETAKKEKLRLVGLSALMTTTVGAMEETIRLLRAECPGCKVMVGGAVLTAEHAARIGADYYSKDAMGAVRSAAEVFGR